MKRKNIILASESPRRRDILKKTHLAFRTVGSGYEEKSARGLKPEKLVEKHALGKAQKVSERFNDAVIIGADTIVVCGNKIFGIPKSKKEAEKMLHHLSGKMHRVITGIAVVDASSGRNAVKTVETKVYFRKLTGKEIKRYIESGESMDKAGSYGIQGRAALFVKKIDGCYLNVVGLPLSELTLMLKKFGVEIVKSDE